MKFNRQIRSRFALPLFTGLLVLLAAPAAQASFHLIKVREVFPGTTARPNSGYVELQMYASGQNLVQLGNLKTYGSNGAVTDTFTPSSSVAAAANQSTVLIADSEYAAQFPTGPAPDFTDSALNLNPAGGAVCWPQNEPPFDDCASWGNFSGQGTLASPDSAPAAASGIPNGMAIRRSIAGGSCSTLLEEADDTDNSSVDFASVTPAPRANATSPTEAVCTPPVIDTKPANPTKDTSASFTYHSVPAGESLECKLDLGAFADCEAGGVSYPGPLGEGSHSFQVRARGGGGTASYSWRVDTTAPAAVIDSHPLDPSPGKSAGFTFHADEFGSSFECALAKGAETATFAACASGKTYTNLSDGMYTFTVKAKDQATNVGPASTFTWEVDESAADLTPPQTTILARPPDPSASASASFTYASNEPGSSFECALDGASFGACPAAGISYGGLANGPHGFQVRAIDPSANVDPTPAGYSFSVAAVSPGPVPGLVPLPIPPSRPGAPQTIITGKPGAATHDRTPSFRFRSDAAGATFACAVDRQPFKPCRSPFTAKSLKPGHHTFAVRAAVAGVVDPSPGRFGFEVTTGRRR